MHIDNGIEPFTPWLVGKSPLPFQVRRFIGRCGKEVTILVDRNLGPAFYPNLFLTCYYLKTGKAADTCEMVLRALGMARAWASARGRDLDYELREGAFINLADAEALADHLMLSVPNQAAANTVAQATCQPSGNLRKLERFRPCPRAMVRVPAGLDPANAFIRIKWVAQYIEWHLQYRLGLPHQSREELRELKENGKSVVERLRQRGRGSRPASGDDETKEGLPLEIVHLVSKALQPGAEQNPFTQGFIQHRNELIWHFFISSGGRRTEVQSVLVRDVTFSTRRMFISKSKTYSRTVPISALAAELFDRFIDNYWSKLPKSARKRGFLFTSAKGELLSPRAIGRIFEAIRTRVPECPGYLTPHTMRRTWNDHFCATVDSLPPEKRVPAEEEMRARNRLQGWSPTSEMGARYARRHIRQKSDEIGEQLANTISTSTKELADE